MLAKAFARSIPTPRYTITAWHSQTTVTAAHPGQLHYRASTHHAADLHLRCARRSEAHTTPRAPHTRRPPRRSQLYTRAAATTSPGLHRRVAQLTLWHSTANTGASPHAGRRRRTRRHAEGPRQAPPQGLVAPRRPPPRMATRSMDRRSLLHSLASAAPGTQLHAGRRLRKPLQTAPPPRCAPKMTRCRGGSTSRLRAATPPWPPRPAPHVGALQGRPAVSSPPLPDASAASRASRPQPPSTHSSLAARIRSPDPPLGAAAVTMAGRVRYGRPACFTAPKQQRAAETGRDAPPPLS
ncbi:hypothetical protein PVAP13_7KG374701 [Panicum virgatum]|uniref:Uncharacterized protein n=1 Tax=Panicum virgatum TaxID=38727 RepID=A0A8T0QRA3_PANVG|nr:hypothetical protein PVAP13_7KG374701 [Panicum virgatum]